jgi:protein-disulfide isomerase
MHMIVSRRSLLAGFAGVLAAPVAEAAGAKVPAGLAGYAVALGLRVGGNGRRSIAEFFDYNCPYCKSSGPDIAALLAAEPSLSYGLVHWPVFGEPSAAAARTVIAYSNLYGTRPALSLHQTLLRSWGQVDGEKVLREVERLGGDWAKVAKAAQGAAVAGRIAQASRLAGALGLNGTPSFIINGVLYQGQLDLAAKRSALAA